MQVTFYKNSSPKIQVSKNISQVAQKECQAQEPFNISNNELLLGIDENIADCNYCYNAKTRRYYFINSITMLDGERMRVTCTCDVLMSFKNQLLNNGGIVSKQSEKANYYLNDSNYTIESRKKITTHKFPLEHFSTSGSYVVKILGG